MITSRSEREFYDALDLAGLPHPTRPYPDWHDAATRSPLYLEHLAELGDLFLQLWVAGIDFCVVGTSHWYNAIFGTAPDVLEAEAEEQNQDALDQFPGCDQAAEGHEEGGTV